MYEDAELERKFKVNFLKNNRNTYSELEEAVGKGDQELAYRLVHSVKGNAGQAKMKKLAKTASEIEKLLGNGAVNVPDDKLKEFKKELDSAITELKPLLDETDSKENKKALNKEQTQALFNKLKPLLEENDSDCLELLEDIHRVSRAEELAAYIEQYEFSKALKVLKSLDV